MQKLPEAPDKKWSDPCTKKETFLRKKEIHSHLQTRLLAGRTPFCRVPRTSHAGCVTTSIWLQGKDKTQSCKLNNYINKKEETKCSNNCVGEYKNLCETEKSNVQLVGIN